VWIPLQDEMKVGGVGDDVDDGNGIHTVVKV